MKLRYTPLAILDLQEIRGYIQDVLLNPEAGENVLANIAKSCAQLKEHPHMGIELRKKLNREIDGYCLISGNYLIIYDIDEAVSILRVLDTRTNYVKVLLDDGGDSRNP